MPLDRPSAQPIAAVELETGLSKDVLRAWEKRYGFPAPIRDAHGDRLYPEDQIRRLKLLRTLTEYGERPGKLVKLDASELAARIALYRDDPCGPDGRSGSAEMLKDCMALVADNAATLLEQRLNGELLRLGLERFAEEVAAPLCFEMGLAWERGEVGVYQEHLFSQILGRSLRQNIDRLATLNTHAGDRARPKVLLTTAPGEIHELGLLMVEATLCAQGANCINLGPQMPLDDVLLAAQAHNCRIVALSFSSWFDPRRASNVLLELRSSLPSTVALWAGGANAALRRTLPEGIRVFSRLDQIAPALAEEHK